MTSKANISCSTSDSCGVALTGLLALLQRAGVLSFLSALYAALSAALYFYFMCSISGPLLHILMRSCLDFPTAECIDGLRFILSCNQKRKEHVKRKTR